MITRIKGKGFKGQDFDDSIGRLTLFIGENGAGKSARSQAIALAVQGFIPGQGKTNQAIFEMGAEIGQDRFSVEVDTSHKVSFYRRWLKKPDTGSVSVDLLVNGRKASAQVFDSEMGRCGGYAVADLSMFMGLSDRKKIDEMFSLYPPSGELSGIERQLIDKREALNKNHQKMKGAENTQVRLRSQRSEIRLPSMPLGECKSEYERGAADLAMLRDELKRAEENARGAELFQFPKPETKAPGITVDEYKEKMKRGEIPLRGSALAVANPVETNLVEEAVADWRETAINSLKAVLDVINRAGCDGCAAILAVKREIKKIRGAAA